MGYLKSGPAIKSNLARSHTGPIPGHLICCVTRFKSLGLGVRKLLVLLEKVFKDRHQGDLSRTRFINT
jgi:hypothetical protein